MNPPTPTPALNDTQRACLDLFSRAHPTAPPPTRLKFCRARKFDPSRAIQLYANYQGAIRKHALEGISRGELFRLLGTRLVYYTGARARDGAMLLVVDVSRMNAGAGGARLTQQDLLRLAFHVSRRLTDLPATQAKGICLVVDLREATWSSVDTSLISLLGNFFQNNVPVSLRHILLLEPPWWLNMAMTIVLPFLSTKLQSRLEVVVPEKGPGPRTGLTRWIDFGQVPEAMGGGYLDFDWDTWVRGMMEEAEAAELPVEKAERGVTMAKAPPAPQTSQQRLGMLEEEAMARIDVLLGEDYLIENGEVRREKEQERRASLDAILQTAASTVAGQRVRDGMEMETETEMQTRPLDLGTLFVRLRDPQERLKIPNLYSLLDEIEHGHGDLVSLLTPTAAASHTNASPAVERPATGAVRRKTSVEPL